MLACQKMHLLPFRCRHASLSIFVGSSSCLLIHKLGLEACLKPGDLSQPGTLASQAFVCGYWHHHAAVLLHLPLQLMPQELLCMVKEQLLMQQTWPSVLQ